MVSEQDKIKMEFLHRNLIFQLTIDNINYEKRRSILYKALLEHIDDLMLDNEDHPEAIFRIIRTIRQLNQSIKDNNNRKIVLDQQLRDAGYNV